MHVVSNDPVDWAWNLVKKPIGYVFATCCSAAAKNLRTKWSSWPGSAKATVSVLIFSLFFSTSAFTLRLGVAMSDSIHQKKLSVTLASCALEHICSRRDTTLTPSRDPADLETRRFHEQLELAFHGLDVEDVFDAPPIVWHHLVRSARFHAENYSPRNSLEQTTWHCELKRRIDALFPRIVLKYQTSGMPDADYSKHLILLATNLKYLGDVLNSTLRSPELYSEAETLYQGAGRLRHPG